MTLKCGVGTGFFCGGLLIAGAVEGQSAASGRKPAQAMRVEAGAVRLDGRLDESVWAAAPSLVDFVQKEPIEGAPPAETTDIRFLYDDTALYVGARLSGSAHVIQAPMTRRDDGDQADNLLIDLDTYLDRRTSHAFGVTASGVRLDRYHSSDNENNYDSNFDPVWQARTHVDERGWTAELWIPFSQLRFNRTEAMVWGLNLTRWMPALNERDYWVAVPRTESGWASRFGELRGLDAVRAPRRLEVLPYVAGSSQSGGDRDPADPFNHGANADARTGGDLRMGIGPNLTLDATVNPDFGQIEADPAEVNLSAFETFFDERRPFFLEGSGLISGSSTSPRFPAVVPRRSAAAMSSAQSIARRCRRGSVSATTSSRISIWICTPNHSRRAGATGGSVSCWRRAAVRSCRTAAARSASNGWRTGVIARPTAPRASRSTTATSTSAHSAATSSCAGSGGRARPRS